MAAGFHVISEANHRILNPFTEEKLMLLGEVCRLEADMQQLDLCCGKGEMLCQWAKHWNIRGVGVDITPAFLEAAHQRATELWVDSQVTFVEGDAATYQAEPHSFDIVSCIGATWIGNGLVGTLKLMQPALREGGLLLVGEPYWITPPPEEAYASSGIGKDEFTSLIGTLDRIEDAGMELVEMVLADQDSWDRYVAAQWWTVHQWLQSHPEHPDASALREWIKQGQRNHLEYQRQYLGWGVFVLRVK